MRIERTGKVALLTPRVIRFLTEALGGIPLDDVQSPEATRIDYACLRGLVGIEMKTFEEDGSERLDNLTNDFRKRDDWPIFLGSAPMDSFLKNTTEPDTLRKKVTERIGRNIVTHLRKANDQLAAHEQSYPRKNLVRLVMFVNEDHEIYDPQTVAYILGNELRRIRDGVPRYANVDAVLYLTERHASVVEGRVAFPIVTVEAPAAESALWKHDVIYHVTQAWADWNSAPLFDFNEQGCQFTTIDHIPEMGPRHERWRLGYRRNPYLRTMPDEQLRDRFYEIMYRYMLCFILGSPEKPPECEMMRNMEHFTHMITEMANRGLPSTAFPLSFGPIFQAARRLKASDSVLGWLEGVEQSAGTES